MSHAQLAAIQRWPVKGLGPDPLASVRLTPGQPLPFDRAFAIENGPSGFDPDSPKWLPKSKFLMLMRDEKLAALETRFGEADCSLEILRHGKHVAGGRLDEPLGRAVIEQFLAAYMDGALRGAPKIVTARGHTFSDVGRPVVSLLALESVRDLERIAGRIIDPLRFRANLHLEGLAAWGEMDLVGREIALGGEVVLRARERITRCAATNVDPHTGARDMQIPHLLLGAFGQADFGVYAEIVRGGTLRRGDPIAVI